MTRPLLLLMDARYTRVDVHDGISRYGASLVEAVHGTADPDRVRLEMLISDERQLRLLPAGVPWHRISSPTSVREPWVARQIRRIEPDVVFSPLQTMGSWGRRHGLILTLHDLIYHEHPTPPGDLPEPLRWLGINAGLRAMTLADAEEERTGRSSRLARLMAPLTGGH